ncbi:hypothetical protein STCU_10773 [Strigomonas culicis]|uniref:Uncharacterized protein n=1 Tax=Strigomonas culicis TaxID=28005 RepID=S9V303_9TRYP|nr:hypothetical protein STCU_10773 [Strigomonas culicis]|eukprot:EPY17180.1 hypothetical protein STCU_10773 [Strigomonas culicis]
MLFLFPSFLTFSFSARAYTAYKYLRSNFFTRTRPLVMVMPFHELSCSSVDSGTWAPLYALEDGPAPPSASAQPLLPQRSLPYIDEVFHALYVAPAAVAASDGKSPAPPPPRPAMAPAAGEGRTDSLHCYGGSTRDMFQFWERCSAPEAPSAQQRLSAGAGTPRTLFFPDGVAATGAGAHDGEVTEAATAAPHLNTVVQLRGAGAAATGAKAHGDSTIYSDLSGAADANRHPVPPDAKTGAQYHASTTQKEYYYKPYPERRTDTPSYMRPSARRHPRVGFAAKTEFIHGVKASRRS